MYTKVEGPAYTKKKYMGGIPNLRIAQFETGNITGDFPVAFTLIAKEQCQIRHTAIESARIVANKYINKKTGNIGYHMKVRVYPHHILRENKQATGAGADRVSQGMRNAFGKAVSRAARIKEGQKIMTIRTSKENSIFAREALRKAGTKLPTPFTIIEDTLKI